MKSAGKARAVDAGDCPLAKARVHPAGRGEQGSKEGGESGIVPDDENVLVFIQTADKVEEFLHGGFGSEGFGDFDFAVVAGFGADQRGGLEGALEGAGDDAVELDIQGVEEAADEKALLLSFLIEGPLDIYNGVGAACSRAGMTKNIEIHSGRSACGPRPPRTVCNLIVTIGSGCEC